MATTKRATGKRWVCPARGGGVLAPSAPRLDDVRRYCLDCSKKTGRLVKRTCPALDRQRTEKRQRAAERGQTKKQRDREREVAARSAAGVDLLVEAKRMWELPALKDLRGRREFPDITFRRARNGKAFSSGHCWYGRKARITVTIGTNERGAWKTLLHELVHAVLGSEGHSTRFWNVLMGACNEAWPEVDFRWHEIPVGRGHYVGTWATARLNEHYNARETVDA